MYRSLERDVTRREAVDQKIADQLQFEEGEQPEQGVDSIIDSMVFAEEAIDGRPPRLYYLIHWKRETHREDTWEPMEGVAHLRQLLKSYHAKNSNKPTATSSPIDKSALPPPMAARSGAKMAPTLPKHNHSTTHNKPPVQLRRSRRRRKQQSKF